MGSTGTPLGPEGHSTPENDVVPVGRYRSRGRADDRGLVVLAMRRPYWVFKHKSHFFLCVREADAEGVKAQLRKYERESRNWPPRPFRFDAERVQMGGVFLYAAVLALFYWAQTQRLGAEIERLAMNDSEGLWERGEWWRPFTGLTLHAEIGHLGGNLVLGAIFGGLLASILGNGIGWLVFVLGGVLGNLCNSIFYMGTSHFSLGASTGVFAALGGIVGANLILGPKLEQGRILKGIVVPVLAGLVLFGWWGVGDARTDFMAHVFGFACGAVLGLGGMVLKLQLDRKRKHVTSWTQTASGVAALALVLVPWLYLL